MTDSKIVENITFDIAFAITLSNDYDLDYDLDSKLKWGQIWFFKREPIFLWWTSKERKILR